MKQVKRKQKKKMADRAPFVYSAQLLDEEEHLEAKECLCSSVEGCQVSTRFETGWALSAVPLL